jgi:hypothetical protein
MADLGTIGIAIEVRGKEALRQIETDMTAVDRTAKSAARSFEAFERAGLKTADTFRYMSESATKRFAQEQKITQELVKQRQAAEQLATANAKAFQASVGRNLGLGAQGVSASASASAMEAEIERLRMKYDQTYVAAQLYEKSLTELNQAHMLGVTSTRQHEAAVESLRVEYQAFQTGVAQAGNRFAQYTAQSASGMNQFGVVTQQAGYQIGDFLVQVQSGTNWMVAFGQQATQLVGILPLMGAGFMGLSAGALVALSAGLGIAIPLVTAIGAAFMRTGEQANSGSSGVDTYTDALQTLTAEIQRNQEAFLKLKFDTESSGIAKSKQEAEQLRAEISSVTEQLDSLKTALRNMGPEGALFSLFMGDSGKSDLEARLVELEKQLFVIEAQAEAQRMLNGELSAAAGIQKNAVDNKEIELNRAKELLKEHAAQVVYMGQTRQESDNFVQSLISAYTLLANSRGVAAGLADEMARAASARQAALVGGGRSMTRGGPELDPYGFRAQLKRDEAAIASVGGASKKLKSGLDEALKSAEALQKQLEAPLVSAVGSISDAFGDFVARGLSDFKGFVKSILASFKNMIAQMIAMAVKNRIMLSLGIGGITPTAAAAGEVAGVGSASGMLGSFAGGGVAGTGLLGGFGAAMPSFLGGAGNGLFAVGANAAAAGGTFAATAGAIAAPLLAVAAVFSFFKKKTKELDAGLRISVTNMDAFVKSFQTIQTTRFWGLSKKTTTTESEVSAEISDPIVEAVQKMQTQIVKAAELFGISSDAFENFVYDFEVSLKGLTEEQKIQKVNEEILKMGDAFTALSGKFTSMNELLAAAQQRYDITTRLLQLQGKEEELLARQRELELAAVHDLNRDLLLQVYALEDAQIAAQAAAKAAQEAAEALQVLESALQQANQVFEEATRVYQGALSDLRQAMDREMSAAQSALDNAQSVLDGALRNQLGILEGNLSSAEDAVRNAQQSLEEAQRREFEATIRSRIAAVNSSFASLISSIEQRLEVAQQKAEASRRIFEVLDSALQERRLVTAGREFASRQAALSYVSGGGSDPERLSSALSVLNEPTEQLFSSFQDYARDFALTTNAIQESRDLAEATMTADEQMVVLLEQQLESSKASQEAQLEALEKLLEVQEEFLTVTEATQQLLEAQETYDQAKTAHEELLAQYPQLQETFITVGDALAQYLAAQATFEQVQKQHEELLAQFTGLNETLLTVAQATANLGSAITAQSAAQQAQADAQAALAKAIADAAAVSVAEAVPAFAYGGMHSGGMRLVGENGPELEVTGPSRIYSNRDTANMFRDPQLAGAVDGLRREVSGMRSEQLQLQVEISKNVKRVYDIERKWDTDGLPPERV